MSDQNADQAVMDLPQAYKVIAVQLAENYIRWRKAAGVEPVDIPGHADMEGFLKDYAILHEEVAPYVVDEVQRQLAQTPLERYQAAYRAAGYSIDNVDGDVLQVIETPYYFWILVSEGSGYIVTKFGKPEAAQPEFPVCPVLETESMSEALIVLGKYASVQD